MKDESRLIFIGRNNTGIKEYKISRVKLISYSTILLIAFAVFGKFGFDLLVDFSYDSKVNGLERSNAVLLDRLSEVKEKIENIKEKVAIIGAKDDELRVVLGMKKLGSDVREVGIGGSDFEYNFDDEVSGFEDNIGLGEQLSEISKLEREIKLELNSYTNLMIAFQQKQDSLKYLPSLKPVLEGYKASGFGMRNHPVLIGTRRMHEGLDFAADVGTPIYASADGVIKFTGTLGGYGKTVKIDHKYGYRTLYGHMVKYVVRQGQQVKRGQKIGEVGKTGLVSGPH